MIFDESEWKYYTPPPPSLSRSEELLRAPKRPGPASKIFRHHENVYPNECDNYYPRNVRRVVECDCAECLMDEVRGTLNTVLELVVSIVLDYICVYLFDRFLILFTYCYVICE